MKNLRFYTISAMILSAFLLYATFAGGQPYETPAVCEEADISLFFTPGTCDFSKEVPTPYQVLGFNVGCRYAEWNDIIKYLEVLEKSTGKVSIMRFGKSYQSRDFIQVCISSEENIKNLGRIKEEHLALTDAKISDKLDISAMPVVVNIMASIHGNEASGVNAILPLAYYLTAQQGGSMEKLLDSTVIILTPGLNPDGINRFAVWVNSTASKNHVADLNSREFTENWPSSRTNHYWIDCNRDWLSVQHPEGRNSMLMYSEWMPNVVLDMHEQGGTSKGFYFSPGDKNRTYKDTPHRNQELTAEIAKNTARALDGIGTMYFSKEGYDDYFIGKGAAYGDLLGSVAILHEQIASRGFLRPTGWGNLPFWKTVRNQTVAALSIIQSSYGLRETLLGYQREFYRNQEKAIAADKIKGYRFTTNGDKGRLYHFIDNMLAHKIKVYKARGAEDEYILPLNQKKYYIIKSMWDTLTEFEDSTFYDVSTWTFPYAYNLSFTKLTSLNGVLGEEITSVAPQKGEVKGGKSNVAYLFDMTDYYAPYVLSELLKNGIRVRVASKPFIFAENGMEKEFRPGSVVIPASYQDCTADRLYGMLKSIAEKSGVDITSFSTGYMQNFDFGSPAFKPLVDEPEVALVSGRGMNVSESGALWHLLDRRFDMNHTVIDWSKLTKKFQLSKYNVMIFANGTPNVPLSEEFYANLAGWVKDGGTLIVTGKAAAIANKCGLTEIKTGKGRGVEGVILKSRISLKSPLFYGFGNEELPVFKMGANTYSCEDTKAPAVYADQPYISGYISDFNLERISGSAAILVAERGKGRVIFIADDLNFRSYWYGTSKILLNAILFRDLL